MSRNAKTPARPHARCRHRRKSGERSSARSIPARSFSTNDSLAQHEWARMKANDSLECRNCHGYDYMDFTRQSPRAAFMHSTYLATNEKTCIDCHKGIAHRLPDVTFTTDTSPRQDPLTHPAVADSAGEASAPGNPQALLPLGDGEGLPVKADGEKAQQQRGADGSEGGLLHRQAIAASAVRQTARSPRGRQAHRTGLA